MCLHVEKQLHFFICPESEESLSPVNFQSPFQLQSQYKFWSTLLFWTIPFTSLFESSFVNIFNQEMITKSSVINLLGFNIECYEGL